MREKTFKNRVGTVEVYGDDGDPIGYAEVDSATKVGLFVHSRFSETEVYDSASIAMTPKMAREVAARIIEWADAIEQRKKR